MAIKGTFQFPELASKPSAPPVGAIILYVKTDNVLYIQDSSGTEFAFGSVSFISQLVGDVSAIGPGIATATVNSVGGSSAANIHLAELLANAATPLNSVNQIIKRDASGNYAANVGTLNALKLLGSVSGTLTVAAPATFSDWTFTLPTTAGTIGQALITDGTGASSWASVLMTSLNDGKIWVGNGSNIATQRTPGGDISMTDTGVFTVNSVGGSSAANIHSAELAANAATSTNTVNTIVKRGAAGEISIGALAAASGTFTGVSDIVQLIAKGFAGQGSDIFQVQKSDGTVFFKIDASGNATVFGTITASNLSGSSSGTNTGDVTLAAVGTSPNANAASITGQVLTLQPADATHPGVISTAIQSIAGAKTFLAPLAVTDTTQSVSSATGCTILSGGLGVAKNIFSGGNITAAGLLAGSNFSGSSSNTNTGDVTLAPVGSTPAAEGASIVGQVLTLQPADGTHPGLLTILAQSIQGIKTFLAQLLVSDTTQSTTSTTGSIVTQGGLGVVKNINAGGTIAASNFSGSSSGTNTGDVTKTDTDSIAITLAAQNISAALKLSSDAADAGNVKATTTIHSGAGAGLHVELPFGNPVNIGTSNNPGSSTSLSLADHVHAITWAIIGGLVINTYVIGSNAVILATDTLTQALGKLQAQLNATVGAAITSLTGDVTGTGPGATATTISVGAVTDTKASLSNKPAVTVVATTNQTLSGAPTIDGQATTAGTSIALLTAQTTASQNGPWVVQSGAWTRPTWFPSGGTTQSFQFITTLVRLGTVYQGSTWRQTTAAPITIDTTATAWSVTPESGNFKSVFTLGVQTGSAEIDLTFANANQATLAWNPTSTFKLLLPPSVPPIGSYLSAADAIGTLAWTNPLVNIDGGTANSNYTSAQVISGGTP